MAVTGYREAVPLAPYTTFNVGGSAEYFAEAYTVDELVQLLLVANQTAQPVTILGGGSNVLVSDSGVPGCVIKNSLSSWHESLTDTTVEITVGAGMVWDELVAKTVAAGWWGLENLSHIPGTVGATPVQNVGAYGVEVAEYITAVEAVHLTTGEVQTFAGAECAFAYRDSWFKTPAGRQWVITAVTFWLATTPQPKLTYRDVAERFVDAEPTQVEIRKAIIDIRKQKFPDWTTVGTAGSFFKNPIITREQYEALAHTYPNLPTYPVDEQHVKVPLGWILDNVCNLRGVQHGSVGTYAGQALVLVAERGATAVEVTAFANEVVNTVRQKTDITVDWEVTALPYEARTIQ